MIEIDREQVVDRVAVLALEAAMPPPSVKPPAPVCPTTPTGQPRRYVSFASKFAHFFISQERFPIYDSYAERMLLLHLGASAMRDPGRPYEAFTENLRVLMREYVVKSSYRELDRSVADIAAGS